MKWWWWGPLCTRPTRLDGFKVLAHCNNSSQIDMLPHSDTLSRFRANQSLLFLLIDACLAKKQDIPILGFPTIYRTRGDHTNHYTTDVVHMRFGEIQYNNKCSSVTIVFHNSFEWYRFPIHLHKYPFILKIITVERWYEEYYCRRQMTWRKKLSESKLFIFKPLFSPAAKSEKTLI